MLMTRGTKRAAEDGEEDSSTAQGHFRRRLCVHIRGVRLQEEDK